MPFYISFNFIYSTMEIANAPSVFASEINMILKEMPPNHIIN